MLRCMQKKHQLCLHDFLLLLCVPSPKEAVSLNTYSHSSAMEDPPLGVPGTVSIHCRSDQDLKTSFTASLSLF